jgi:hypothetical protein
MNNKPDLPDGWAMPDDLAKRVSGFVNKKPITPEDELQDALGDMARDIALIEPNPVDWGWWISYLLVQMEGEAQRRGKRAEFEQMLKNLRQDLDK